MKTRVARDFGLKEPSFCDVIGLQELKNGSMKYVCECVRAIPEM
jgi:hypothetical protein